MGLLDDAIREHLELKRLRGADPGQVAREEHEALGPVDRGDGHRPEAQAVESGEHAPAVGQPAEVRGEETFPHAGQETTELDMSTVLGEGSTHQPASIPPDPDAGESGQAVPPTTGDSLEWEMPREHTAEPTPAQEVQPGEAAPQEQVDDVLEETPDFLRETPEQERLWFEQRPPRDFDFDK